MSTKPTHLRESYFERFHEAGAASTASQAMSLDGSKRDRSIPRRPLLWLAAALLFTLPPMFGSLVRWVPWVFLLALAMKFWMEPRGYRLRFATLKLLLAAAALFVIFASYGSLKGVEPGISLLVVLVALKVLEAHTAREFQVMVLMGWVLCLCGFFLSQEFEIALSLLTAFALLLVALIQFHRGSSPGALWPPLGTAGKILLQAAPLVVLLFVLFPRINTGLRFDLRAGSSANTGFSERLSPGNIAALTNSSDIAFRAEFPGRTTMPTGPMYWRGAVMWHCDGLEWHAPYVPVSIASRDRGTRRFPSGNTIRQRITLAPHGARWMFALDRPFEIPSGAILARGDYLWSVQTIRKPRRYEVVSSLGTAGKELTPGERREALEVPPWISPAVRELAQSWAMQSSTPRAVVNSALQFFQSGFRYSLSPGQYGMNDLEQFLFHRRIGFCEHYAASFATLMRLAGIPARVVVGYLGGEYNDLGHFFLVRQADTHAWCEVWLPESGWTRVDPTTAVAPGRASLDLNSFLERGIASGQMEARQSALVAKLARSALFTNLRLTLETLSYEWDTRVMAFDADVQEVTLDSIGLANRGPFVLIIEILIVAVALLVIYFGWMQLRTRSRPDRVKTLYEHFCRKAARLGVQRDPFEGPADFSNRAAQLLPNESKRIRQISNTYITLRYAPEPASVALDGFAKEVRAFGRYR
jgi:transglutaminase-like putative cysteine protease